MEQDETLRERFFRERRMLLGVSLVLLAHYCLGITVGKSAETLGLHFEVDNPERLWPRFGSYGDGACSATPCSSIR